MLAVASFVGWLVRIRTRDGERARCLSRVSGQRQECRCHPSSGAILPRVSRRKGWSAVFRRTGSRHGMEKYDLIVIGSGPAGQRAAIQAAKFGKRVALVERLEVVGGVAINTGTIPSKTIREAVLHLSGFYYQNIYGVN